MNKLQVEYLTEENGKYPISDTNATDAGVSFYREVTKKEIVEKINEIIDYLNATSPTSGDGKI